MYNKNKWVYIHQLKEDIRCKKRNEYADKKKKYKNVVY